MRRLKAHLLAFLVAIVFGMLAYGVVHMGLKLHRWLDADSLRNHPAPQ